MAKPNYQFDKRQREIAKNKQQEEKRLKKLARKESESADAPTPDATPPTPEEPS